MAYRYTEKARLWHKGWYQENKERLKKERKGYFKLRYQKNKEKTLQENRKYRENNKEKISQSYKIWYKKNKEKKLQYSRIHYQINKEKRLRQTKEWYQKNKNKVRKWKRIWAKSKRKMDPKYRLNENMGSAISISLKGKKAGRPWEAFVNYTLVNLIEHLESLFDNKMNWQNYGSYWSIDHIKPKSLFNYISPEDKEFKECWSLRNLQPIEKIANSKKRNSF